MKVSQNWLKEFVEIKITPEELSEKLSIGGFEVESLTDCSENVKGVVLGRVEFLEKHNDSDKLSICSVNIGTAENLQIVCGAKNIRSGILVFVATVGSHLANVNLTIKKSEIRGVVSEGMICSLQELGLEEESEGIEIVEEKMINKYPLGTMISEILKLNDHIFDLAITANRPDGMSVLGISREISALLKSSLNAPSVDTKHTFSIFKPSEICFEAVNSKGVYTISFIDNVDGSLHSPDWLKSRLNKSDIKSINLIVDITNYIMLEQGQPLHAFDKDKLSMIVGREVLPTDFGVRKARSGEKFLALDGQSYILNENVTLIICSDIPIAIAGVIGGLESSVTETTKNICLEAAVFSPTAIRKSTRHIGLRTESSSRFEKGISLINTNFSCKRAIDLLKDFFEPKNLYSYSNKELKIVDNVVKLRRDRIHKILGPILFKDQFNNENATYSKRNINDNEIIEKLELIGCNLKATEYGWDVTVLPSRENDLIREIDLIEEIARLIGYDSFDQNIPDPVKPGKLNHKQLAIRNLKNGFISNGFYEVLTFSLVSNDDERIRLSNPLFEETSCLRNNIWQEHIRICNQSIKSGINSCWIFEIGNIFEIQDPIKEYEVLSGAICGNNKYELWENSGKLDDLNYYEARGKLKEALSLLKIQIVDKPTDKYPHLHPGRSATLLIEGKDSGYFGQMHPSFMINKTILKNIYLFRININNLVDSSTRKNKWIPIFKNYPTVPKMERDINFIFRKEYLVIDIVSQIRKSGKKLLEEVKLLDIYEDEKIGEDNISYTFRLSYRDPNKTLIEEDISEIHKLIINTIERKFKTKLRE